MHKGFAVVWELYLLRISDVISLSSTAIKGSNVERVEMTLHPGRPDSTPFYTGVCRGSQSVCSFGMLFIKSILVCAEEVCSTHARD